MSTNRINTALVAEGRQLTDLLAGLVTRSPLLRLKVVAVVDLDPGPDSPDLELFKESGLKRISTDIGDILTRDDLDLVILGSENNDVAAALRTGLFPHIPVLGPEAHKIIQGAIRLAEDNRALRADSRRLKETRLRLNIFVETAPLSIYIKDTELRYRKINNHAQRVLGVREAEVVGKRDSSVFPEGGARWLQKVEQETLNSRRTLHATGVLPVQNQMMHVQVTLFPVIENGRVEGLYGLIEDTTELFESEQKLHQVDEQLNETQKYLREVLENSRDIIFLTDPRGNILTFNSGAEAALGYTRDEVVGTQAHQLCAIPGNFEKLFSETMREGHASSYEAEFRSKERRPVICNVSLTLIDGPDGKPLEVVCLCRDLTTRLRLKNDLIRSERLAAVGQMASGVAHEINNPLAVIDTIAGLVEETLEDEGDALKPETKKVLGKAMDRLHHQVRRVTAITHSLLGFVRTQHSGMANVDIEELLEECLGVLGTEIRRSQTEIVRLYAEGIPEFTSDPMLLQQVFVNLMKNALDAMHEAPSRPGILEIMTNIDSRRILVTIQDNGVGIPPEDQEKIFNLFHTTKPAGQGTGLGLSIVHDILYRLGGTVRVASEPGHWSRFVVEVPLHPPETLLPDPSISL
ncbi:MAG: PAS domain S-box protein [Candidatus Krumholzibacteriota bacterium]